MEQLHVLQQELMLTLILAKKKIIIFFGEAETEDEVKYFCEKYGTYENANEELSSVAKNWEDITGQIKVKSSDDSFDLLINFFLLYQTISCRMFGRSSNYQSGGAYGGFAISFKIL